MKTLPLIVTIAAGLFTISGLQAQTTTTTTATRHTVSSATLAARNNARQKARFRASERTLNQRSPLGPRVDGSVVRAIRGGNPLQMINPAAPAEYGDGRDVTRHEDGDPGQRPQGLKLFAIEF